MAKFSSKSTDWLNRLETVNRLLKADPNRTGVSLAGELKVSPAHASYLMTLNGCLDQAAIDKIRSASHYSFSLNSALALAGLKDQVSDLTSSVHACLDVVLTRQLATKKIKNLVAWVISGKPASEFDPNIKLNETQEDETEEETGEDHADNPGKTNLDLKKLRQLLEKAEAERIQGNETKAQENLEAYLRKIFGSSPSKTSKADKVAGEGIRETVLLDWLADINVFKQIQSKRKKGKSLTGGEWTLLAVHKFGDLFGYLAKFILKLFKLSLKLAHWAWKRVIEALKELGIYQYAKAIMTLVILIAVIWFTWEAFHYGVIRPVEMIWSRIHFSHAAEENPTPVPVPQTPISSVSLGQPRPVSPHSGSSRPVVSTQTYQPAVSFVPTAYNPQLLEMEIAAIRPGSRVSDFAVTIDEGMPGDVAVSRMQGVTDPDKYTMMIGGDREIISSINPTTTTLEIHYKSADPFGGFLKGNGEMTVTWEDVRVIHVNEIDGETKTPPVIYHFTLIAAGGKFPLTLQCGSPDDLEHLVSTMEYFIRHSRLGRDTALGGMPYPSQGLVLNNDCVVEKLWADSPMGKAGVALGDMVWSLEKNAFYPPGRKKLEAGLNGLQPGPHALFIAANADFIKAQGDVSFKRAGSLNPKRASLIVEIPPMYPASLPKGPSPLDPRTEK